MRQRVKLQNQCIYWKILRDKSRSTKENRGALVGIVRAWDAVMRVGGGQGPHQGQRQEHVCDLHHRATAQTLLAFGWCVNNNKCWLWRRTCAASASNCGCDAGLSGSVID